MSNLLRSLLLTTLLSFTMPILLVSGTLAVSLALSYVPGLTSLGQIGASQILGFLTIFGSGYPIQGMLIVGLSWGMVGGLFELYNFYLYQDLPTHK
ncbi:MAG: hypothetical protein MUD14_04895 [Hydrococcus sp. Prado102]|nr:hypothetical protein [Hydrococcus sp. Prado102]